MMLGELAPPKTSTWILQHYSYVAPTLVVVVVTTSIFMNEFFLILILIFQTFERNMKDLHKEFMSQYMHLYMAYEDVLPVGICN